MLRGVRSAGIAFATSIALILMAAVAARLGTMALRLGPSVAALLVVVATTTVGFVVGYAPRPDIARLLLSIDLALATGERLCSLHELRSRGGATPLENRIATKLLETPPAWRRVLRLRRRDALPWAAGGAALGLALFLSLTITPPVPATTADPGSQARAAGSQGVPHASSVPLGTKGGAVAAGARDATPSGSAEPFGDALAELLPAPPSRGLLGDLGDAVPAEVGAPARDLRQSLSDYLSQLLGRAEADQNQTFALTEREREALQELMRDVPTSSLRRSLSSVLRGETGNALKALLEESQRLLEGADQGEEGETSTQDARAPVPPEAEATGSDLASAGWVSLPPPSDGEGETTGAGERRTGADAEEPETLDRSAPPRNEEGGSAVGGEESGEATPPLPGVGFIPEELLGDVGSEGDLRRYFTKGIPFEPPVGERAPAAALSLDYEVLRALLAARVLAPEVQTIVRTYFAEITRGGP